MKKLLFYRFIDFVKNPNKPYYPELAKKDKLQHIIRHFLPICIMAAFLIGMLTYVLEKAKLFDAVISRDYDFWTLLFAAVLLAPPVEELIFRGFLGPLRRKSYFRWLYYVSSLVFGFVHLVNYENGSSLLPFFLILTGPQIFIGLLLGYIRIVYGFKYAVLLHAVYNLFVISLGYGLDYVFDS